MFRRSRFYIQGLSCKIILLTFFILLAFSYIPWEISPAEMVSSEEYFKQGLANYEAGKYKSAMENFSESLFLDPTSKQAKHYLEKSGEKFLKEIKNRRESERREILKRAQEIIVERKKKVKENYGKGIKHYKRGEFLRAGEEFNAVLEIEPEHREAKKYLKLIGKRLEDIVNKGEFEAIGELYYAQGTIFYINGEWGKAISQWKNAVKHGSSKKELSEFIKIAEKRKQEEEALERAEVLYRDVMAHYDEGKIDEAIKMLEEAIRLNPEHKKAREFLARAKDKIAAMKKEKEVRKRQETVEKHYFQGIDYYAEGEFKKAIKEWEKVLKVNRTHKGAKEYLKKARDKIASANSRRRKRKTTARRPEDEKIEVYYRQGINSYLAGRFRDAIRQWQEVLKMEPAHKSAREYIAKAKERLKISEEEIGYSVYEEEIEEYIKELEKAGTIDEEKEELITMHYQDGLVAYAHGDLSQAMKEWRIVLKLDPEHKKARRALIKLQAERERRRGKK